MVIDHIKDYGHSVNVAEIDERLELSGSGNDVLKSQGREYLGCEQAVDGDQMFPEDGGVGDYIRKVRREIVRTVIAHGRVGFNFIDGQGLKHIGAERGEVGYFPNDVEKGGGYAGCGWVIGSDMELIHDHVREVGCDECGVVPWVGGCGADQTAAVREGHIGR